LNLTLIKYNMGCRIKEARRGGVCSMHGSGMHTRFYGESVKVFTEYLFY